MLSVVIPAWSGTPELAEMAFELCKRVKPMCDELLVGEDSGNHYPELETIADKYFLHPENLGDVVNINFLMRRAAGEYICAINTDIVITEGNIRDLCMPGRLVGVGGPRFTGGFYVVPRSVLDDPKYGYPDESLQHPWKRGPLGMGADADWEVRCADILFISDRVRGTHRVGYSYAEKRRLDFEEYLRYRELHPSREVDPSRHRARLHEEIYGQEWGDKD